MTHHPGQMSSPERSAKIRQWAKARGYKVAAVGTVPKEIVFKWLEDQDARP